MRTLTTSGGRAALAASTDKKLVDTYNKPPYVSTGASATGDVDGPVARWLGGAGLLRGVIAPGVAAVTEGRPRA